MHTSQTTEFDVEIILARVDGLEQRIARLEAAAAASASTFTHTQPPRSASAASSVVVRGRDWTQPYEQVAIEVSDTWIELHEPSARPQLHRIIQEVVGSEGPVTEKYVLRRVREAWGVKRAGARIQQVFEQALRQLAASQKIERRAGDVLIHPGRECDVVRVPDGSEHSQRSVDEVPRDELALCMQRLVEEGGAIDRDELTATTSRMFGWTRRGTEIQAALDAAVDLLETSGRVTLNGAMVTRT